MFERSRSGQQNRAIFFGVDYVCYVEGGGGLRDAAPDITFWQTVFRAFRPELKVKFAARGGKPILERLARDVVANDLSDTLVAIDSDYDDFRGRKIVDRRVLYSHGYSWENDAFTVLNLEKVYCAVCHCGGPPTAVQNTLRDELSKLEGRLARPTKADFFALCAGSSILPRDAPGRVISTGVGGFPVVNLREVVKLTRAANENTGARQLTGHTGPPDDALRYCVGRVIAFGVRVLLRATIHLHHGRTPLPPDHLRDVALLTLPAFFVDHSQSAMAQHHAAQLAAI